MKHMYLLKLASTVMMTVVSSLAIAQQPKEFAKNNEGNAESTTTSTTHQHLKNTNMNIKQFPAIRYAEPPVGNLRFAPPKAIKFDASKLSNDSKYTICPQTPSRLNLAMGDFEATQSEDCLKLSVSTPAMDKGSRPVLFWIHGGGFSSGGGNLDWYNANKLAQEGDIVVVSPNYRLGALGFLTLPGVSSGNLAIQDIEMALKWTRDNIRHFGGDPNRITVMGQSAGAWTASLLVSRMPKNKPTIHQLILESGSYILPPNKIQDAQQVSQYLVDALPNKNNNSNVLDKLRNASVDEILSAQNSAIALFNKNNTAPKFAPVFGPVANGIESPIKPEEFISYLEKGAKRVPVMVGWTKNEMRAFNIAPESDTEAEKTNINNTTRGFVKPSMQWALNARKGGKSAYVYSFDWSAKNNAFGACHTIELPFVFGNLSAFKDAPMLRNASAEDMEKLSKQVRSAWLAFIKTGNPNTNNNAGLPNWPVFDEKEPTIMHISTNSHAAQHQH